MILIMGQLQALGPSLSFGKKMPEADERALRRISQISESNLNNLQQTLFLELVKILLKDYLYPSRFTPKTF
jgi:hypothetical protein